MITSLIAFDFGLKYIGVAVGETITSTSKPLECIKIKKDGSIIRESFSDNYGYWEARLPVGEYSIVFSHEDFEPYSKTVSLNNDKKEVEIR